MKLSIPLINGQALVYEGTYEELLKIGEDFVAKSSILVASPSAVAQLAPMPAAPMINGSGRWTEQTARRLMNSLYGDQGKLVRYLVRNGGVAKYKDIGQQLGLVKQKLAGVLSSITRNAQKATGHRSVRLLEWRRPADGKDEYYIAADALPFLTTLVQQEP